jgi:CTP synthase
VNIHWLDAESLSPDEVEGRLADFDGILVPGGFGVRGIEGKVRAARWAREQGVPYLGVCLGMQVAVVEFARHVAGLEDANSAEFDPVTPHPVIDLMREQHDVHDMGGTMRLGAYPCKVLPETRGYDAYGEAVVYERHRHRFEVNNAYRQQLTDGGLVISGLSPDERLVEMVELPDHPWFVGMQGHPEFKSRPTRPAPLFRDFIGAAVAHQTARQDR